MIQSLPFESSKFALLTMWLPTRVRSSLRKRPDGVFLWHPSADDHTASSFYDNRVGDWSAQLCRRFACRSFSRSQASVGFQALVSVFVCFPLARDRRSTNHRACWSGSREVLLSSASRCFDNRNECKGTYPLEQATRQPHYDSAMTINKSQGQTFQTVGVDLTTPVFSHGMLYVAMSRVTSPQGLHMYAPENLTRNVVYEELIMS